MAFTDLPTTLQYIFIEYTSLGVKIFLYILIAFLCFYGISRLKKGAKTPFILVAQLRFVLGITCYAILFTLPLASLFIFDPRYSFDELRKYILIAYLIATIFFMIVLVINIYFWTPVFILKAFGYDPMSESTSQIAGTLNKWLGDFKYKRNKFINNIFKST